MEHSHIVLLAIAVCLCVQVNALQAPSRGLETACSTMSCCEMTPDQLSACANVSSNCPGYDGAGILGKDGACGDCPPGECRVVNSCVCPEDFLAGNGKGEYQSQCKTQYGEYWPTSIELNNTDCTTTSSSSSPSPTISAEEVQQIAETTTNTTTSSPHYGVGGVVEYIREEAKHGTNVVGQFASAILVICLIAVACCAFRRRR